MARIMIVDDEESLLIVLESLLKAQKHEVIAFMDAEKALGVLATEQFDLLISDVRMSPMDGIALLKMARSTCPSMAVIMLTAYSSIETATESLKLGAFDYLAKPFKVDELVSTVGKALEYSKALAEKGATKPATQPRSYFGNMIAESSAMKDICELIKETGNSDRSIFIYGEKGTGKKTIARNIHAYSGRKHKKFLSLNCATLPGPLLEMEIFGSFIGAPGAETTLFKSASGGSVFLAEVGSLPVVLQERILDEVRLLRQQEEKMEKKSSSVRIMLGSHVNAEELMNEGKLSSELYKCMDPVYIEVLPLRERKEDILPLVFHLVQQKAKGGSGAAEIDSETCAILESYSWPGNVIEMENVIQSAVDAAAEKGNRITKELLPQKIAAIPIKPDARTGIDPIEESKGKALKAYLHQEQEQ
jgi:two-component system response regulator PilR (NtrC family)